MPSGGRIIHVVRRLKRIRKKDFAKQLAVSDNTLYRLENDYEEVSPELYAEAAKRLDLEFDWRSNAVIAPPDLPKLAPDPRGVRKSPKNHHVIDVPPGISGVYDAVSTSPIFEADLSAGPWIEIPVACGELDYDDPVERKIIDTGKFRLHIRGDSMEPKFPDGCTVEFSILRANENPKMGSSYAVCRSDSTATFKKLVKITDDNMILEAINTKKYRDRITVPRQEVTRIARAIGVFIPVE